MDRSITYYFEDLARLDEVSVETIQSWIEDMPYSQPLHKLIDLKVKRTGSGTSDSGHQNAAYHNADADLINIPQSKVTIKPKAKKKDVHSKKAKKVKELDTIKPIKAESNIDEFVEASLASQVSPKIGKSNDLILEERQKSILSKSKSKKAHKKKGKIVSHKMASDDLEELVQEELLEEDTSIEDVLLPKVTEDQADISAKVEIIKDLIPAQRISKTSTLVKFTKTDVEKDAVIKSKHAKIDISKFEVNPEDVEIDENLSLVNPKKKNKKNKKKKKGKGKKSTKSKNRIKEKEDSGKKKKKKDKEKSTKNKSKVNLQQKQNKKRGKKQKSPCSVQAKKQTSKNVAKEVRYIYLEERQPVDFRIHGYEGESDYIKWLMSTKSKNEEIIVAKPKKKAKKGRKNKKVKKSIKQLVLKSAEESVKKRDVIISETLADILAAQGHEKKAKKMYKQLSLIFPEKSSFFAAKIKKLKKK